ncbi:hypothetical protein B566_EDAN011256, partial [Ephemera danica]
NIEDNLFNFDDFKSDLTLWASKDITQIKVCELLKVLRTHPDLHALPLTAKTLLETPRTVETRKVGNGLYCHLGIRNNLEFLFSQYPELQTSDSLLIQCNADGMPSTKSTNDQIWPILISFPNFQYIEPVPVGIYYGKEKPSNVDGYFEDFVNEINDLHENKFAFKNNSFTVKVLNFVFDSPAKSLVTCTKGHAGYYCCMRCKIKGSYHENKVVLDEFECPPRTNEEFRTKADTNHHNNNAESPLEHIPYVNMVADMVLDYMHLVLLGVVRMILFLFLKGKCLARLPAKSIKLFNEKIQFIRTHIPSDFSRKPRSITDLLRWKATECRLFLLYTSPYLLPSIVSNSVLKHFLSLHVAIRILVSKTYASISNIRFARTLLDYFVRNFKSLYGRSNMTFNVHGLLHIVDDVERFGPLDDYSAFRYENFLQTCKKLLRKAASPLQQIYKRLSERRNSFKRKDLPQKISNFKEIKKNIHLPSSIQHPIFKSFQLNSSTISCCSPNNTVVMDTGEIVRIQYIGSKMNEKHVFGYKFEVLENVYTTPMPSIELGIYKASGLESSLTSWPIEKIKSKAMAIPYETDKENSTYYVAELLHHEC